MKTADVIIIGAGAAGLMCAIEAGKRGRKVVILDHANKMGKKILMSGGGRCNFTNLYVNPDCYISHNPHFCKSALARYTQWDFIELVKKYKISYHEKALGQLFCDHKSKDIVEMLFQECQGAGVEIFLKTAITKIKPMLEGGFRVDSSTGQFSSQSLVIATGGLSIPTMGASPLGYKIAEQFGIPVWPTRAGLVPFTLDVEDKKKYSELSGVSVPSVVQNERANFQENMLFTHRGLSGPSMLQISSYWNAGERVRINLLPEFDVYAKLLDVKELSPQKQLNTVLQTYLPKRLISIFVEASLEEKKLSDMSHQEIQKVADLLNAWDIQPNGTEGYRTAEVTLGGVDCDALSSKTMEATKTPGLYFIGEVVDVTGWLGGYNFQWAWSSGYAAGQVV